ncbi:MAG TPA: OB-fold domain-containing protein [Streptosporangiaceae bacterium]|jgi:hypothetical protein
MTSGRPAARPGTVRRDPATAEFFAGTSRGELLLRRCGGCAAVSRPQARSCPRCQSADLSWVAAAGTGTIVSWSVVHARPSGGTEPPPAVVAIVGLSEGPWLHALLAVADPAVLTGGEPVTVSFERPAGSEDAEAVPVFRLA